MLEIRELDKSEAKAIRNRIVDLRIKNMYLKQDSIEKRIARLLETLYPISIKMVSRYGQEKAPHYTTACGEAYPMAYWTKRKVIEEHCLKCKVCNVLLGYSKAKTGYNQNDVAKLFELGIEVSSSSGNFVANDSFLWHYGTIEAIRTLEGKIIDNLDCFARGFAKCTKPKSDAHINLTTFGRFVNYEASRTIREIRILEAKGSTTLFEWRKRFFLNATDEQRFISELIKPCKTIGEAYESMKPEIVKIAEGLKQNVKRQGDFFLIETVAKDEDFSHIEKTILHKEVESEYQGYDKPEKLFARIERLRPEIDLDSRHTATRLAKIGTMTFVKGFIRHPEHTALKLEAWHRVVKNVVKASISVSTRGAD